MGFGHAVASLAMLHVVCGDVHVIVKVSIFAAAV